MSEPLLIGVHLGTTGTRAVLYRAGGAALAEAACDTPLRWTGPGRVDQDPEGFVSAALGAISACVELLGRDDVLITPHAAPHTAEATAAMGRMAVEDVLAVLAGREPRHPVTASEAAR